MPDWIAHVPTDAKQSMSPQLAGLAEVARFTDIPWSGNNDANDPKLPRAAQDFCGAN